MTSSSTLPSLFAETGTCWLRNVRHSHPSAPKPAPFPMLVSTNPPTPPWDLHIKYYFLLSMTTSPWQLTSKANTWEGQKSLELGRKDKRQRSIQTFFAGAQVQKPWSRVSQRLIKGLIFSSPGWRAEWNTPLPPLPTLLFLKHTYGTPTTRRWTTQEQSLAAHLLSIRVQGLTEAGTLFNVDGSSATRAMFI